MQSSLLVATGFLVALAASAADAQTFQRVGPQTTYDAGLRCAVPRFQVADLNRDGLPDFVLGSTPTSAFAAGSAPGEIMVWLAQADGSFQERARQLFNGNVTAAYLYSNVRIADLNGDGIPDIFVPDGGVDIYGANGLPTGPWLGATPKLALSSGAGFVDASSRFAGLPSTFSHSADIADIDRNGSPDIYVGSITNSASERMPYLLVNDGRGNFSASQSRLPSLVVQSGSAPSIQVSADTRQSSSQQYTNSLFVDVNRDGAIDLVLFPIETVPNGLVLLNDGAGNFNRSEAIILPRGLYGGGMTSIRTNPNGSLTFGQSAGGGTVNLDAKAVDLNNDGYPDIVVLQTPVDEAGNVFYRGGKIQILINQGGRGFVDESAARGAPGYAAAINHDSYHGELAVFDMNGDGFPDLVAMRVTPTGYFPDIFLNDGSGKFTRTALEGLPTQGFIVPLSAGFNQGVRVAVVQTAYRGGGAAPLNCNLVVQTYEKAAPASANVSAMWWNPAESGWGLNLNHQGNSVFATLFTYDASGAPLWLVMSNGALQPDGATFAGDLYRTTGPAFNANPFTPITGANVSSVGRMSVTMAGSSVATLAYTYNGTAVSKGIQKQVFGTNAASCTSTTGSRAGLTNYQDLWWKPDESGWGLNVTHQGDTLFATLFTYDAVGKGLWLVMAAGTKQADGLYAGDLFTTTGPAFNAQPFTPLGAANITKVGTMQLRFADGVTGTLAYSVNGASVTKPITRQVFSSPLPSCTR